MVVVAVLALLAGRLVQLQGLQATAYAADAEAQRRSTTTLHAVRGQILDRNGQALALSVDGRAVYGEPRTIAKAVCAPNAADPCNPTTIGAALAPVLGQPADQIAGQLSRTDTAFVYLARDLDPAVGSQVAALGLPGVGVLSEPQRVHPGGDLAANVVGFTNREGAGAAGVEYGWQSVLAGKDGLLVAERDHAGRIIPTGEQRDVAPVPGRDVQLTLDRDLQWYAQQQVAAKVKETKAVNGTAVVMDVQTGQILALATAPTFDPDHMDGTNKDQLGNPAISSVYEPGSVNKIITAAAALEEGIVTPDTEITVPPTYQVGGHTVHDAERHGTEHLTFAGVLVKSSNIGTVKVAQQVGPQRLYDELKKFGMGEMTGLGLPGESRGVIPAVPDWSGTSIATIPIGQGMSANAVQIASVYATAANGGVRVPPSIVKATVDANGVTTPVPAAAPQRVISEDVAAQLRTMLEGVVSQEGTAPLAAIPGYRIAGKTGTAQRVVNGRYAPGNYNSSFVGFAPADAPRLVTAIVLQGTGKKAYFGGATAGPVFKDVMGFALRGLAVPPTGAPFVMPRVSYDKRAG